MILNAQITCRMSEIGHDPALVRSSHCVHMQLLISNDVNVVVEPIHRETPFKSNVQALASSSALKVEVVLAGTEMIE